MCEKKDKTRNFTDLFVIFTQKIRTPPFIQNPFDATGTPQELPRPSSSMRNSRSGVSGGLVKVDHVFFFGVRRGDLNVQYR